MTKLSMMLDNEQLIDWRPLAKLMDQTFFGAGELLSATDDPFEELSLGDTVEHTASRHKSGRRNKLGMFLRRRGWRLVESQGQLKLNYRQTEANANQLRRLAVRLQKPREGLVYGAGLALHDLSVDVLSGATYKVAFSKSQEVDRVVEVVSKLPSPGKCNLGLVDLEFEKLMI